jgi:protocatechuate 3,4-dioxygenase beta subunit
MNEEGKRQEPARRRAGLTRRQTLGLAGTAGAALALGGAATGLSGCGDSEQTVSGAARSCLQLTPEQEEGPFYVDLGRIRRNVVEGSAGLPLALRLRLIDPAACLPIEAAAVDIWHCNALGVYGDEASEGTDGEEFLRGTQLTDARGYAEFRTVYPGHYEGRATHIHVKVHVGGRRSGHSFRGGHVAHTGQLFFPEPVSDRVYARPPYSRDTSPRVPNAADGVYVEQGGSRSMLKFEGSSATALSATIALGVDPNSTPSEA